MFSTVSYFVHVYVGKANFLQTTNVEFCSCFVVPFYCCCCLYVFMILMGFFLIRLYLLIGRLQPIPRVSIEKYIQFFSCLSYKFLWFSKVMTLVYFSSCLINLLLSRSQTSVYFHKTSACSIPLSTFFKMA